MNKATNPYGDGQACKRIIEKNIKNFKRQTLDISFLHFHKLKEVKNISKT